MLNTLILSPRARQSIMASRFIYSNRSQVKASRDGYLDALADVVRAADNAGDDLPESVLRWIEDNA
jgi:hypothetical protein